ncbi:EthD family reductase [Alloalcanivorax profundimaris]|uniref:EthD family reductase n=1 Tax=Alloalcanivorax profundimaris TaxID=2735259 RepID=UPI0018894843|nr:EthD family reductase [Alloalcanivorax profundimaris]MBF1800940.1 EthD family reductase [Alloalcanivorax profundimaris]MCQ6261844.1 EthD family reductase [Alcanivorax sp. MM125-6]
MHKFMVLYPRPDDEAHFRRYYADKHLPLASTLPGLKRYECVYPEAMGPHPSPHFCIFEGWFESERAMRDALDSEVGRALAEDVSNYSPKGALLLSAPVEPASA